ncbi:MAG TPA: hypothetical protein VHZ03_39745 [Trebonia sp.]|jgi:hypothetical protein|nr:hypothetical protein [Trebonia sp.]
MLVAAAPHAALETARAVLGNLLDLPQEERDLLLATFEAWVKASGSASAAAQRCTAIPTPCELVTAVRAWCELPHS